MHNTESEDKRAAAIEFYCHLCVYRESEGGELFQHFYIYCLTHGDKLTSMAEVVEHAEFFFEKKERLAFFCGECGRIFSLSLIHI